jgi:nicotinate-nucleotide adenylyltransferase
MKVGFFGGSFDPPHVAHVLAAAYVLSLDSIERLLVVPVFDHALKRSRAPFEERLEMCRTALGWLPNVEVSPIEAQLGQPSLTLRTLQALKSDHPEWELRLVIGSDVLFETQKWHAFEQVAALAPPLVLGRVGAPHELAGPALLPDISSSRIRALLRTRDQASAAAELACLVPGAVLSFIEQRGLYR